VHLFITVTYQQGAIMNDWLHNLPIVWMGLLVFGLTGLVTAAIHGVVIMLSVGERARSFKTVSPGLLPPLGILFALFVAFTASQVWSDNEKAISMVDREASALRTVVILASAFPGESEMRLRGLVHNYIADTVAQEWPLMAHRSALFAGRSASAHAFADAKRLRPADGAA
jgi:Protein of unknown function (DUF4239)